MRTNRAGFATAAILISIFSIALVLMAVSERIYAHRQTVDRLWAQEEDYWRLADLSQQALIPMIEEGRSPPFDLRIEQDNASYRVTVSDGLQRMDLFRSNPQHVDRFLQREASVVRTGLNEVRRSHLDISPASFPERLVGQGLDPFQAACVWRRWRTLDSLSAGSDLVDDRVLAPGAVLLVEVAQTILSPAENEAERLGLLSELLVTRDKYMPIELTASHYFRSKEAERCD